MATVPQWRSFLKVSPRRNDFSPAGAQAVMKTGRDVSGGKTDVNQTGCPLQHPRPQAGYRPSGFDFPRHPNRLRGGRAGPGRSRRPYRQSPFHTTLNGPGSSPIYGEFS